MSKICLQESKARGGKGLADGDLFSPCRGHSSGNGKFTIWMHNNSF